MSEKIDQHYYEVKKLMNKALEHLEDELTKIRAGKANPSMLDSIYVNYYGNPTALQQVANVTSPDAKTLAVKPWEKKMLGEIEKAIFASNIGFTPVNDGETIRISLPPLTEERRKDLVKKSKAEGEHAKISIRNIRREANELIKAEIKNGLPEDEAKEAENKIQNLTNQFITDIDKLLEAKEADILKV